MQQKLQGNRGKKGEGTFLFLIICFQVGTQGFASLHVKQHSRVVLSIDGFN